jgi:ApbE superfamily uncharacterized protein (UPF0280 family)
LVFKYHFSEKESDITIISEAKNAILQAKETFYYHRNVLERYVFKNKLFLKTFTPIKVKTDLIIIKKMIEASELCDVGPMAAVAGALADIMLETMKSKKNPKFEPARIALVENGGEVAIDSEESMKIALYAGKNQLNINIGFLIKKIDCPIGIGTSSATVGHAISLGQADAATIFAKNAALADAAATKVANLVKGDDIEKSIKKGLDAVNDIDGAFGAFISRGNKIGSTGKIPELIKIEGNRNKILKKKIEDIFLGDYEIFK